MNRREALSAVSFLLGGTIIGGQAFLSGCSQKTETPADFLTDDDISLLNEIGETILPATSTSPGAKEARVGEFMKSIVADCYSDTEKGIFTNGLMQFRADAKQKFNLDFLKMDESQKREMLLSLEKEAKVYTSSKQLNDPEVHYYSMIKQLTVCGFLSSEAGATKALRHVAVPGRYEGCIPIQKDEKAWG